MQSDGVLLINLGTPDSPNVSDVRRYLREFLSDPRVIDLPKIARSILLNTIILPFRPRQSAHAYRQIWTDEGSPLLVNSRRLQTKLGQRLGSNTIVELGMRYGRPTIKEAMDRLIQNDCRRITLIPLFPQYSSAATGSAIEKALEHINKQWNTPSLNIVSDFYDHPAFIHAYAEKIKRESTEGFDLLLLSYHGLPERHIVKSRCPHINTCRNDMPCPSTQRENRFCYRSQCFATSNALARTLNLKPEHYLTTFQSRLGRTPWIKPYTDLLLPKLAKQGIQRLAIACPSFVADCLETLEEIGIRANEQWRALTGNDINLISCLNDDDVWVDGLKELL